MSLIDDICAVLTGFEMTIVVVEKWTIRPEMMPRLQEFLNDLPKWKKFDESYGGKVLGVFNTLIGESPNSRFMGIFTMPDWETWGRALSEAEMRMPEESKRWNEMITNASTEITQQVG